MAKKEEVQMYQYLGIDRFCELVHIRKNQKTNPETLKKELNLVHAGKPSYIRKVFNKLLKSKTNGEEKE